MKKERPVDQQGQEYEYLWLRSKTLPFAISTYKLRCRMGWEIDIPIRPRWSWSKFRSLWTCRLKRNKFLRPLEEVEAEISRLEIEIYGGYSESKHFHDWAINSRFRKDFGDYYYLDMLKYVREHAGERPKYEVPEGIKDVYGNAVTEHT